MSQPDDHSRAHLLFDPTELAYNFGEEHPMQPRRLVALMDLLESSGLWKQNNDAYRLPLRAATEEELRLVHTADYIAAVQRLSKPEKTVLSQQERGERNDLALRYGFGEEDTPALPGMHEAAALIAGGTLIALSAVMGLPEGGSFHSEDERPLHVFHPAGGWHHAWAERASGFCVYNDIAIAIAHVLRSCEAKVLYIDFDVHHGDGVQRSFYDEPRVMTVSFHETGRYLFPGTGDILELGLGLGRGYSVNVPLEPFTEDQSFIDAMNALLPPLVLSFAPDVIISLHGCDTHSWDPLAHLELTLSGIAEQMKLTHQLAHIYCQGRWVALGGGGYDPYRIVPRAWSMLWAEMSEQSLPAQLPEEWVARWRPAWQSAQEQEEAEQQVMGKAPSLAQFPTTFEDRPEDFHPQPHRLSISQTNQQTVAQVRQLVMSSPIRRAFPGPLRQSPMVDIFDLLHVQGSATPSRSKVLKTFKGTLLLRDFCPPSLVEHLHADSGLTAFARLPEREHDLLLKIAKSPDCALTLAHTPAGEIIGQVTLAPGDEWWGELENVYEVAIEVSSNWSGMGIAKKLLAFALELDALEEMILFALGLSWHWDLEGMKLPLYRYRRLIAHLFETQGFVEHETTEPDISREPGNILLVRVGKKVDQRVVRQFFNHVMQKPSFIMW
jgi:acetoin utilization deacetylase AcuC-like enzyme/GNAT superfamily N-acetyltransferase